MHHDNYKYFSFGAIVVIGFRNLPLLQNCSTVF